MRNGNQKSARSESTPKQQSPPLVRRPCRNSLDAALYSLIHRGSPGDLRFYLRQCEPAQRVLELGCGYGRIAAELARRGKRVVGLDIDPYLLASARQTARELDGRLALVEADMSTFSLGERFERVIIPHSALYCLLSRRDVLACFRCVRRHLTEDGILVFDAYAADAFHAEAEPEAIDARQLEPVVAVQDGLTTWHVYEKSRWDKPKQRLDVTYVYQQSSYGTAATGRGRGNAERSAGIIAAGERARNSGRNVRRDVARESGRDAARERARNSGRKVRRDAARESAGNAARNPSHELARDRQVVIRQRYLLSAELAELLDRAGFRLLSMWGDFSGRRFGKSSESLVIRAAVR